jgi:hypothetical protein
MENLFQLLTGTMIFKGMDGKAFERLFRQKTYRLKKYEKEEYIAHIHDDCDRLMIVLRVERREITLLDKEKLNNLLHKINMDNE